MKKTVFREYDIRGIFPEELNKKTVNLIGYFLGKKIKKLGGVVSIGYDSRSHSTILRDYLISGLNFANCKVLDMGMVATPVNYFSNYINFKKINASIMITGSHNPIQYNGFKITLDKSPFFGEDIYSLRDIILKNLNINIPINTKKENIDIKKKYIDYMVENFQNLKNLKTKIILDGGNGVVDTVISDIFKRLNLNFEGMYLNPDGNFPNHHPDPSEDKNLIDIKKAILNKNFDIGFAYDGDADRIALLTKKYNIKGDYMAILFALNIKKPATIIGEVKCSQIMYEELEKRGFKTEMYKTGHSNLKVKIKELDASLACEVSGHIFFKDRYFGYDDAIYATLRVLELIKKGINLDKEIEKLPKIFSTDEIKIKTTEIKNLKL